MFSLFRWKKLALILRSIYSHLQYNTILFPLFCYVTRVLDLTFPIPRPRCNSSAIAKHAERFRNKTGTRKLFNRRLHTYTVASCGNSEWYTVIRDSSSGTHHRQLPT